MSHPKPHQLPLSARVPAAGIFEDDWRARPTLEHPFPVILIHGTGVTKSDWRRLGPMLREEGLCVFAPDFGKRSTEPVAESAAQVAAYIDAVMRITGAAKVILVGHSQGGIIARYWMHLLGGADKVHQLISLSVPNHGTVRGGVMGSLARTSRGSDVLNAIISNWFGPSGFEMLTDSPLIAALNQDGDCLPGVYYSSITTRSDAIITPVESCFLEGDYSHNFYVQDENPYTVVRHENMPFDFRVCQMVLGEILDCPLQPAGEPGTQWPLPAPESSDLDALAGPNADPEPAQQPKKTRPLPPKMPKVSVPPLPQVASIRLPARPHHTGTMPGASFHIPLRIPDTVRRARTLRRRGK